MEKLKSILKELMQEMGIEENISLKIVPMKQKIASFSFNTKILRLNQKAVEILSDEELKYILSHELIHLKIKDVNHGFLFMEELKKYYTIEEVHNIEIKIIKNFLSYEDAPLSSIRSSSKFSVKRVAQYN